MIINVLTAGLFLYSFIHLAQRISAKGLCAASKALRTCPTVFMLYLAHINAAAGLILLDIWVSSFINLASNLLRSSNHMLLSFNIITYFSMMMLILFHNLKIAETHTAR